MVVKSAFISITLLLCIISLKTQAQERHAYEITLAGFTIGEMEATKLYKQDTAVYLLKSEVSFWLFGRINVDYLTEVKYHNGQFVRSTVSSSTNRGNFLSRIWLQDEVYEVRANSYRYELDTQVHEEIDYSAVRLFFEEPKDISKMMAENYGQFCMVTSLGEGMYDTLVEGNKNRYHYKDGKMQKAVMQSPIKNYVIKRKE
jgi:hypothetical protein